MGKKPTEYFCDVCNGQVILGDKQTDLQVIFTTEQTEGRSVKPYLCMVKLDLCNKCHCHVLEGHYLYGSGAMGHNTYEFRK